MVYGSKFAKKTYGKARRYAKKRYVRKGSGYGTGLRLNKLSKDILLIKSKLNTEKKYITTGAVSTTPVGQCANNDPAAKCVEITPKPAVGTGFADRIGKSIKVVAMALEYQMEQQANCAGPRKFKLYICKTKGTPIATSTIRTQFMDLNPITGMWDYMSNRNIDHFKTYQVLKTQTIYLKDDNISGQSQLTTGKCVMKLSHHIQFDDNTTTVTDGQLFWYIVADSGNAGPSDSTLSNVAITGNNTGASFQTYCRFWYVDN
jgi:predicted peptidase